MSRIRLNQEYRNKIANRMRVHIEARRYARKRKVFSREKTLKHTKIKLGNLRKYVLKDNIQKQMLIWHIIFKTNIQT